ncbi:unnamed protein product [Trichobilharzia regenti]|nr:unnamed protein product [Trichobilharzia regenti]
MEDTHPNPQLRYITETGRIAYHPAYKLEEENCERVGRVKENKNNGIIKINLV